MRRHDLIRVFGNDALPDERGLRISGDDGRAVVTFLESTFWSIEAEICLAGFGVEAMTGEAAVGKEGADIRVEAESVLAACGGRHDRKEQAELNGA